MEHADELSCAQQGECLAKAEVVSLNETRHLLNLRHHARWPSQLLRRLELLPTNRAWTLL
jgi:hypothetical protein